MITSLYLANNNIQAVVASGRKKTCIKKVCSVQIPEGSLINGIITNEVELASELKEFWDRNSLPKKNVELVINSSQFVLKQISMPKMKEKRIRENLPMEFADVTGMTDPIIDYAVEPGKNGKMISMHTVMVERSFVQGYISLFSSIGITLNAVRVARICVINALRTMEQFKNKTCIILRMDGSVINSSLWSNGTSVYATQKRVFSDPGTEQFGSEIARVISNTIQFASTQNLPQGIKEAYLAGVEDEAFDIYSQVMQELDMGVMLMRMEPESHIRVKKNVDVPFWDCLPQIGNMLTLRSDMNLVAQARKKTKTRKEPVKWKRYVAVPAVLLVISATVTAVMYNIKQDRQRQLDEINAYLNDPANLAICQQSDLLEMLNQILTRRIECIDSVTEIMDSYPHMNGKVVDQIQVCAGKHRVDLKVKSYVAETGTLSVDAQAKNVTLINQFIDELETTGLFDAIEYTGYETDEKDQVYTINVICYLAETAGK